MSDAFRVDAPVPALLIGMDTPQVTVPVLTDAARRLAGGADAVMGPAADGGYWAIGFQRPVPDAFVGVPMSTPVTGAEQHRRLCALGLDVDLLPELRDVDTLADAVAMAGVMPGSGFAVDRGADQPPARLPRRALTSRATSTPTATTHTTASTAGTVRP